MYDYCYNELSALDLDKVGDEEKKKIQEKVERKKKEVLLELCAKKQKHTMFFLIFLNHWMGKIVLYTKNTVLKKI